MPIAGPTPVFVRATSKGARAKDLRHPIRFRRVSILTPTINVNANTGAARIRGIRNATVPIAVLTTARASAGEPLGSAMEEMLDQE